MKLRVFAAAQMTDKGKDAKEGKGDELEEGAVLKTTGMSQIR